MKPTQGLMDAEVTFLGELADRSPAFSTVFLIRGEAGKALVALRLADALGPDAEGFPRFRATQAGIARAEEVALAAKLTPSQAKVLDKLARRHPAECHLRGRGDGASLVVLARYGLAYELYGGTWTSGVYARITKLGLNRAAAAGDRP